MTSGARHVFLGRTPSSFANNLFDLASANLSGLACTACKSGDPGFVDVGQPDFRLTANSAAVDSGRVSTVYTEFLTRYGLDISRSAPRGATWDIGALER